jgi:hypothetical protein
VTPKDCCVVNGTPSKEEESRTRWSTVPSSATGSSTSGNSESLTVCLEATFNCYRVYSAQRASFSVGLLFDITETAELSVSK